MYSHCALAKQGGALCSPRVNLYLIGQSVPKRQPPEALMTLDREFESQMVELDAERRGKTCAPFFTRCSWGGRQANSDRLEATDYSITDQL